MLLTPEQALASFAGRISLRTLQRLARCLDQASAFVAKHGGG